MMRSIRGRLLAGTVLGTCAVALIGGALIDAVLRRRLWQAFDDALVARARLLGSIVEREDDSFEFEVDYRALPEFTRADRPEYFEIWRPDGTTIARSPSLVSGGFQPPAAASLPLVMPFSLPDGRDGRAAVIETLARDESRVRSPQRARIRVMVARETADLLRELTGLRRLLAGIGLGIVALTTCVLVVIVGRGLRPLSRLTGQIASLHADDLSERIALPDAPGELRPVVDVSNQLLEQLETAVERERSFTADVAHELRTPLAGMRSTIEVALSRARDAAAYQSALGECLQIALQMQTMTGNLLSLARLDRGAVSIERRCVALEPLLRECWAPCAGRAADKSLEVRWNVASEIAVETDAELLRQVLANVLENAAVYANDGGRIAIETLKENGNGVIRVSNTGSELSPEDAQHVFERFWRGDASRHHAGLHAGLGLALARRLVGLLGGQMTASSQRGESFTLTVRLPASNGMS